MIELKNIVVKLNSISVIAGYKYNNEIYHKNIEIFVDNLINVVADRLKNGEVLIEFICQIAEDQHLSEERIQYFFGEEYRFLLISNLTIKEQYLYDVFKTTVASLITP